jgi:hypothetical protein
MATASTRGRTDASTKASISKTASTAWVNTHGRTAAFTKATGTTGDSTVKASTASEMGKLRRRAFGSTARETGGFEILNSLFN